MPEIESEFSVSILARQCHLYSCCGKDRLEIRDLEYSDETAATLAWIINKDPDTSLQVSITVNP